MNYKVLFVVLFLFFPVKNWGQFPSPIIVDPALSLLKGTILGQIGGLTFQHRNIASSYKKLTLTEQLFQKKLKGTNNNVNITLVAARLEAKSTADLIKSLKVEINRLKSLPPNRYPFLKGIESELAYEEKYIKKVNDDLIDGTILASSLAAGGAGYAKVYYAKMILRAKKIKTKVLELEYKINGLENYRKLFF